MYLYRFIANSFPSKEGNLSQYIYPSCQKYILPNDTNYITILKCGDIELFCFQFNIKCRDFFLHTVGLDSGSSDKRKSGSVTSSGSRVLLKTSGPTSPNISVCKGHGIGSKYLSLGSVSVIQV